ncbi:molybdopterin-binding protein [Aestuariimicrobium sp. p3-SID1156]|uniref:MogA/MoaB family molybdenum cofactor biosynthesis protein n=1 Tax=Aestuariimicrobium sp. p3-SID1156 TaxID=2916038 RepID=UPI00223BC3AF|nr:molybdopterin-binding protein [Aestuariimicrobium sp. p3-SID1156]MCT1457963.1 molybdopterin-binding protein [Aestuariimicrobium sp. p3-SID1156]
MNVSSVVVTASDRISSGIGEDRSGRLLAEWLRGRGFEVSQVLVPDGAPVAAAVSDAVASGAALVLTTGGTGITPRDLTPQVVAPLLSVEIPGILELVRAKGASAGVVGAALTRGVAGVIEGSVRTVVITLPGSVGGCRDAIDVLDPLLDHLLAQAAGGDH